MPTEAHPERLLDLALQDGIDEAGWRELSAHLGQCGACRAHWLLATEFTREQRARLGDPKADARSVRGAFAKALQANMPAIGRRPRGRIVLVAASVFMAASAGAAAWQGWRPALPSAVDVGGSADNPQGSSSRGGLRPASPRATEVALERGLSGASGREASAASEAHEPPQREAAGPPARPNGSRVASHGIGSAAPSSAAQGSAKRVEPSETVHAGASAVELFEQAQSARRQGHAGRAVELYQALQARYPASRESLVSHAWLGQLSLMRGNPGEALRQFERYLVTGGPASEEALAGRARALQALGRPGDEARAWRALEARFPKSIYSEQAAIRLEALSR